MDWNLPLVIPNFVAIDIETTGLNPWKGDRMFAAAATFPSGRKLFWRDDFGGLQELLEDPRVDKVFHNAKFDWRMLEFSSFKICGRIWDTMIFAHLLNGTQFLNLEELAFRYLPPSRWKVVRELNQWFDEHGISKKERGKQFTALPPGLLQQRCEGDATATALLFMKFYPVVRKLFERLLIQEHRLLPIVKHMEDRGMLVNLEEVAIQRKYLSEVTENVIDFCEGIIGHEGFQLRSHDDQEHLLACAGILDQITERTTKTGRPKLSEQTLRELHHPVSHMLLLGKKAEDLNSKFLHSIEQLHVNNVLHAQFNQLGTVTGRFSSSKPNLENQPTEGGHLSSEEAEEAVELTSVDLVPHIKRCFCCRPGYAHLHSDKSKIEVLMLGHYTKDPTLLEVMRSGHDIHEEMSMRMFGEATPGLRVRAKITVFGFQYGVGDEGLAKKIRCTIQEARSYKERLRSLCPSIETFRRRLRSQLEAVGYVQTDHGRRHYLSSAEAYMAVNRMCQGTAADEVKSCMVAIGEWFNQQYPDCSILLNIHDDLGSEIPIDLLHEIAPKYLELMTNTSIPFAIPLPASLEYTTTRWSDLVEYELTKETSNANGSH